MGLNLGIQMLRESEIEQHFSPVIQISIYFDLPKIDEGGISYLQRDGNIKTFYKVDWPHQRPDYKTIQIFKTIQDNETTIF